MALFIEHNEQSKSGALEGPAAYWMLSYVQLSFVTVSQSHKEEQEARKACDEFINVAGGSFILYSLYINHLLQYSVRSLKR